MAFPEHFYLQGSLPSSPRLSENTKVIEVSISNRDNVGVDVSKIYDNGTEGINFFIPRTNKTRTPLPSKIDLLLHICIYNKVFLSLLLLQVQHFIMSLRHSKNSVEITR